MKRSIYGIFYTKQPSSVNSVLPRYDKRHYVTFLNPYSTEIAKNNLKFYAQADHICSDGILPIFLNKLCGKNKSMRISFDMTSLAPMVFNYLSKDNKTIYFVGTTKENIKAFVNLIKKEYPKLRILGYSDGYFDNSRRDKIIHTIISKQSSTVVIGMGTPIQDEFAYTLIEKGYVGNIYTCGGFFHQTVRTVEYYPKYVDQLNLRWLYRIYKEKNIFKRILLYYPGFVIRYLSYLIYKQE